MSSALRIGYSRDQHLYYLELGVSAANVSLVNEFRIPNQFERASTEAWHPGFVAGFGFEKSLTRNLFFGAEYSFVSLASRLQSGPMESSGVTLGDWEYYDVDAELHTVRFRIAYFFR